MASQEKTARHVKPPRAMNEEEKRRLKSTDIFERFPGRQGSEWSQDKETLSREGENTDILTKSVLDSSMVPAFAQVWNTLIREERMQTICPSCRHQGMPVNKQDPLVWRCNNTKCSRYGKKEFYWHPYFIDDLKHALDDYLAGRPAIKGFARVQWENIRKAAHEQRVIKEQGGLAVAPMQAQPQAQQAGSQ